MNVKGCRGSISLPALDEVLEVLAPVDVGTWLVLELGDRLPDNVGEQIDQACARLHLRPIGREGEPVLGNLQKSHARRPDIGCDGIALARDTFRRHVIAGANEGVCLALSPKVSRNTKVAELDLAVPAKEDVGGFDVSVDDLLGIQIGQSPQHALSNLAEHFLAGASAELLNLLIDAVKGSAFAEFHRYGDSGSSRIYESSVVPADVL